MKPMTVAMVYFFFAAAIGGPLFLAGCSSNNAPATVCTDAGADVTPTCVTTTTGGGGGW